MHISEGVLSGPVLISGAGLAVIGTAIGLKKLDIDHITRVGLLSSVFFVASLIHVPLGPTSVHLILNGLVGLLLGWVAFPAILVALLLQAIFFQFGGITTLGVNTFCMAFPAVICFYLFRPFIYSRSRLSALAAFAGGFCSVFLSAICVAISLYLSDENFLEVASLLIMAHIPVMVIEGIIVTFCISFFKKVQPELLALPEKRPPVQTDALS